MENIKELIADCDMLLIGIGKGFGTHPSIDRQQIDYLECKNAYQELKSGVYDANLTLYNQLAQIIEKKNYFVVDTNIDGLIFRSALNPVRVVAPCGSLERIQCGCAGEEGLQDAADFYNQDQQGICPKCNKPYCANIHGVADYNESAYLKQWNLYNKWLCGSLNKKLVLLELGADFEYASIIRWPFEKVTMINNKAVLVRVNKNFSQGTPEIKDKIISFEMDAETFINRILL